MPELPEVEAARRLVQNHCLGGVILKAVVANDIKVIDGISPIALQEALTGKKIVSAHRKGKHLWLQLDSPPWPSFSFGMSGAIIIKGVKGVQYRSSKINDIEDFPSTYSKVHLELDNGVELAFTDKRRFARVRLFQDPTQQAPILNLGFDAYSELPSGDEFVKAIQAKKASVKALLLDQEFLAGIGNWVADEVLYQSRIHPEKPAYKLTDEECKQLHATIKEVLEKAVSVNADSEQFPRSWLFHYRWDRKLGLLDGNQIDEIKISGRTSCFVPALQKYSGSELQGAKKKAAVDKKVPLDNEAGIQNAMAENVEVVMSGKLKVGAESAEVQEVTTNDEDMSEAGPIELKRRGRPPNSKPDDQEIAKTGEDTGPESPAVGKKRGRPPKLKTGTVSAEKKDSENAHASPSEAKKRGWPPKMKINNISKDEVSKALQIDLPVGDEKESEDNGVGVDDIQSTEARGSPPKVEFEKLSTSPFDKAVENSVKKDELISDLASPTKPKRRGRPSKAKDETMETQQDANKIKVAQDAEEDDITLDKIAGPRRRGRPPKEKPKDLNGEEVKEPAKEEDKGKDQIDNPGLKKRGRPPKAKPGSS